ncbi:MAG TPA: cation diffusion facilitator family transporter [Gemmataceae bacterium]|nr:cation diffusion facilitator family transporter [Gemmataceae bacterium]
MIAPRLKYPILLSILAALVTLGLKWLAYSLTGSVGLFSEAAESAVNLLGACTALFSLWYASRPVDPSHTYGHEKIEYFSSGLEGVLIIAAAGAIASYAVHRLFDSEELDRLGIGTVLTLAAALVNFVVAQILLQAARKHQSIILKADGLHLMTDVWTSVGVVAGLGLVFLTKRSWLDPLLGLLVAGHVAWTGFKLVWGAFNGLMDHALPQSEQAAVRRAIESRLEPGMDFHALRTRQAGSRRFVDFHLLVPGIFTVRRAHELTANIEDAVRAALPGVEVTVHIEPIEDRAAWEDSELLPLEQAARRAQAQPEENPPSSTSANKEGS